MEKEKIRFESPEIRLEHHFPDYLIPCEKVGENPFLEEEHVEAWEEYCMNKSVDDMFVPNWNEDPVFDSNDWDPRYGTLIVGGKGIDIPSVTYKQRK
jgi:hypothetical protein